MREGAYETCPKHGAYEPCDDSPSCGECRDDQVATAKDDVLRAAKERRRLDIELAPDHHRTLTDAEWREWCILRNQRDAARVIEDAAVDRWQKLEGGNG